MGRRKKVERIDGYWSGRTMVNAGTHSQIEGLNRAISGLVKFWSPRLLPFVFNIVSNRVRFIEKLTSREVQIITA